MKQVLLTVCFSAFCLGQQGGPATGRGSWTVLSDAQTSDGHIYHLRGHAEFGNAAIMFHADQIDYNEDKGVVHLAGHVSIETDALTFRAEDIVYDVKAGEIQTQPGDVRLKLKQIP